MRREVAALVATLIGAVACDPCAGTLDCRVSPALRLEGRLVNLHSGRSVAAAEISASIGNESATAITGADGLFSLAVPASIADSADYDLEVRPPGDSAFHARGLKCPVTTIRGSGCPLGLVVSQPYFPDVAEISYRGSRDVVIRSATIRFDRTGGVGFYADSVMGDSFTSMTNGDGRVLLFGQDVHTTEIGEIVGRLTVYLPPPLDSGWSDSVRLASALTFREPRPLLIFRVGPSIDQTYAFRRAGQPVRGVTVRLTRVSGVPTATDIASAVTDSTGSVRLGLQPLSRGSVTVFLTVTPPAPDAPFVIDPVVIQTRESDRAPLYGTWDVSTGNSIASRSRRDR